MSQHIEIERATLACMVASPRAAEKVRDLLETRDFTVPTHQDIYSSMVDMVDEGRRIDELTLMAELRSAGWGDDVYAVAQGLYGVAASLASVEHAEEYATVVRETATRRGLERELDAAMRSADVDELVAKAETAVFDARSRMQGKGDVKALSGASILEPLDAFLSAPEERGGFPFPFPYLRENYGLYEKGRYSFLAGYSSDGKTTAALQWIEEICEAGGRVCLYEMEMDLLGVSRMLATMGAGVTMRQAKGLDDMTLEDRARYEERRRQVAAWDIDIKAGLVSPMQIRADQTRERYDAIFVDHMQKFERSKEGEYSDISRYSAQLHRIARDLSCSVVCLSQLKTPQGGRSHEPPTPDQLRGTRQMEEDADDIFFVWRERTPGGTPMPGSQFIVAKARGGIPNKGFQLAFDEKRGKFFESKQAVGPSVLSRQGVA